MGYNLSFHPAIKDDWLKAIENYNEKREGLGFELSEEFDEYILFLKEHPLLFQKRLGEIRVLFTKRFHFGIYYVLNEIEKEIFIVAILNSKENFSKISDRIS